jgi:hypothetical protein
MRRLQKDAVMRNAAGSMGGVEAPLIFVGDGGGKNGA